MRTRLSIVVGTLIGAGIGIGFLYLLMMITECNSDRVFVDGRVVSVKSVPVHVLRNGCWFEARGKLKVEHHGGPIAFYLYTDKDNYFNLDFPIGNSDILKQALDLGDSDVVIRGEIIHRRTHSLGVRSIERIKE